MVKRYRSKPVEIEAEQYEGEDAGSMRGVCQCSSDECGSAPHVHTLHQEQAVRLVEGDYIIPEGDGEHYYPCKPDIFERKYEEIEQ
jgi:hypothetical protein